MASTSDSQETPHTLAFSYQPPAGGDITLKSSDGTIFTAHSVILSLASKVFSDMLGSTTSADIVELAEDAEAVSLMLVFMYPAVKPAIDTIPLLEKAMCMAHKYEVEIIAKTITQARDQQRGLIRKDPLRAFQLSKNYDFPEIQTLAAKLITKHHYDLLTTKGLTDFAREFPASASLIGIVGARAIRNKTLEGILISTYDLWPKTDGPSVWSAGHMICPACWESLGCSAHNPSSQYCPGWLPTWAGRLYDELLDKLLDECDEYFNPSYLLKLRENSILCQGCVNQCLLVPTVFELWAKDARLIVEQRLAPLDLLYSL